MKNVQCAMKYILFCQHYILYALNLPNYNPDSLRLKRKYPLPWLHHSAWTFLMTCPKPSVKISLLASPLHSSLGSTALLLVKKSSYPIMSGRDGWMITLSIPSTHYMVFFPNMSLSRFLFFFSFFTDQFKQPPSARSHARFRYFSDRLLVAMSFFLSKMGLISQGLSFFLDGTLFLQG